MFSVPIPKGTRYRIRSAVSSESTTFVCSLATSRSGERVNSSRKIPESLCRKESEGLSFPLLGAKPRSKRAL